MKRLGIYLVYDKEKVIDKYIGYMLKELKTCINHLVVVCNMSEVICGAEILERYADEIFYRENIGFDAGGFKDALCNFLGWKRVLQYEELILVNDSMFGPFCPMRDIFEKMEKKQVDFWGLAKHGEFVDILERHYWEHIQTYFLSIGSQMLHAPCFLDYWKKMPYYRTFDEVVRKHETKFTQYFVNLGYSYDVLADTVINNSKVNIQNNYSQYAFIPYELMKKRNFPFLKKQPLTYNTLDKQTQENLRLALDYIEKETDYDIDMVWDNVIRIFNMADLQRSLHLQYIISSQNERVWGGEMIAIVVIAEHMEAVEYVSEYLLPIYSCLNCVIKVFSEREEILEAYHTQGVVCMKLDLQRRMIEDLSIYDFVCVLHDEDLSSETKPSCTGKSYFYNLWDNLLRDENHILGIVSQFRKEPRLGFLVPPIPIFAEYFEGVARGWGEKFDVAKRLVEKLQLKCQISMTKPPLRVTQDFWIRGSILKRLNDLAIEDYCSLKYIWTYIAQDKGYYSGIVESLEYASMNEANLYYYLTQIAAIGKQYYGNFRTFQELEEKMKKPALERFCKKHAKIFVYGAGDFARAYKKYLFHIEAYVVSDGQAKPDRIDGVAVQYLSEVPISDECGFILCLNKENQNQVIPLLEERGIKQYFCI